MRDICGRYGIEVNRSGFTRCPFHSGDRTPSLKIYEGKRGFHCFGCGKHGGVIDFVMLYFNLDFKQTLIKLNSDFSINLPIGKRLSLREQRDAAEKERQRRKILLNEAESLQRAENSYHSALDEWIRLDINKRNYAPDINDIRSISESVQLIDGKPFHQKYVEALNNIDTAAYALDLAEGRLRELERQRFDNHSGLDC